LTGKGSPEISPGSRYDFRFLMNKKKLSHVDWLCILIYPKKEEKKIYFFMFNLGEERKRYIGGGIELG
jgi:hypothetical protein